MPTTFATFLLAANKSLRATTRYIDLFPLAITVKLARHFVFISTTKYNDEKVQDVSDTIR